MSPQHPSITQRQNQTDTAYARWAPLYDLIFNLPFQPGRKALAEAAQKRIGAGGDLMVIGVGTGLELELLPRQASITGIDISPEMLQVAQRRVQRLELRNVVALTRMSAEALDCADQSFDVTVAPYVLSVVPHPHKALDEMLRITRPGGEILVLNHFSAESGPRLWCEKKLDKAGAWLGWHPDFDFNIVKTWLAANPSASLIERRAIAPFGLFTLLHLRKS